MEGAQILAERSWFTGHHRCGAVSARGACRLLPTADGRAAVSCARNVCDGLISLETHLTSTAGSALLRGNAREPRAVLPRHFLKGTIFPFRKRR